MRPSLSFSFAPWTRAYDAAVRVAAAEAARKARRVGMAGPPGGWQENTKNGPRMTRISARMNADWKQGKEPGEYLELCITLFSELIRFYQRPNPRHPRAVLASSTAEGVRLKR